MFLLVTAKSLQRDHRKVKNKNYDGIAPVRGHAHKDYHSDVGKRRRKNARPRSIIKMSPETSVISLPEFVDVTAFIESFPSLS